MRLDHQSLWDTLIISKEWKIIGYFSLNFKKTLLWILLTYLIYLENKILKLGKKGLGNVKWTKQTEEV